MEYKEIEKLYVPECWEYIHVGDEVKAGKVEKILWPETDSYEQSYNRAQFVINGRTMHPTCAVEWKK